MRFLIVLSLLTPVFCYASNGNTPGLNEFGKRLESARQSLADADPSIPIVRQAKHALGTATDMLASLTAANESGQCNAVFSSSRDVQELQSEILKLTKSDRLEDLLTVIRLRSQIENLADRAVLVTPVADMLARISKRLWLAGDSDSLNKIFSALMEHQKFVFPDSNGKNYQSFIEEDVRPNLGNPDSPYSAPIWKALVQELDKSQWQSMAFAHSIFNPAEGVIYKDLMFMNPLQVKDEMDVILPIILTNLGENIALLIEKIDHGLAFSAEVPIYFQATPEQRAAIHEAITAHDEALASLKSSLQSGDLLKPLFDAIEQIDAGFKKTPPAFEATLYFMSVEGLTAHYSKLFRGDLLAKVNGADETFKNSLTELGFNVDQIARVASSLPQDVPGSAYDVARERIKHDMSPRELFSFLLVNRLTPDELEKLIHAEGMTPELQIVVTHFIEQ